MRQYEQEFHTNKFWKGKSPEQRLHNARIPAVYRNYTFDTLTKPLPRIGDTSAKLYLQIWVSTWADRKREDRTQMGRGFVFRGPYGSGRTHHAVATLQALVLTQKATGFYTTAEDLVQAGYEDARRYQTGTEPDETVDPWYYRNCRETWSLLVIDDLGQEHSTEATQRFLLSVFRKRRMNCMPVIVTTSLNDRELVARYGTELVESFHADHTFVQMAKRS